MVNKSTLIGLCELPKNKIGPDRFSRFDFIVYSQSDRQAKFIYRWIQRYEAN